MPEPFDAAAARYARRPEGAMTGEEIARIERQYRDRRWYAHDLGEILDYLGLTLTEAIRARQAEQSWHAATQGAHDLLAEESACRARAEAERDALQRDNETLRHTVGRAYDDAKRFREERDALREQVAALEHATRTRSDYNLRCTACRGSHYIDTVIPDEAWNQIAREDELLCAMCIDERLTAKGLIAAGEFYYAGAGLTSRRYTASYGEVAAALREARAREAALARVVRDGVEYTDAAADEGWTEVGRRISKYWVSDARKILAALPPPAPQEGA